MRHVRSFAEAVEARAEASPDAELVRLAGGEAWSASRLQARTEALAGGLARVIGRGDAIATCLPPGPEAIATTAAISRLGAVEVPLPADAAGQGAARLARSVRCISLVAPRATLEETPSWLRLGSHPTLPVIALDEPLVGIPSLDELAHDPAAVNHTAHPRDLALVMSTSGTSGRPKGALLPNSAGLGQATRVLRAMEYDASDVLYSFFPWQHINARHAAFLPALLSGARLVISPRFSASRFMDVCRAEGVTAFNFMGAVCAMLLRQPASPHDRMHDVTRAYGGPAPVELVDAMMQRFGILLLQAYASTELGDVATSSAHDHVPGAAGRVVPEYDVRVVDSSGDNLAEGEPGELLVLPTRSGLTFRGYVDDDAATQEAWRGGWFHTGDRVRVADGWLWFEERSADVIRRRGLNISACEVEQVIAVMPGVADVVVVAVPSALTEDEVLALVVPDVGVDLDPALVREHCRRSLPTHALPRFVSVTGTIARTSSLKVMRAQIRARGLPPGAWDAEGATASPSATPSDGTDLEHP